MCILGLLLNSCYANAELIPPRRRYLHTWFSAKCVVFKYLLGFGLVIFVHIKTSIVRGKENTTKQQKVKNNTS